MPTRTDLTAEFATMIASDVSGSYCDVIANDCGGMIDNPDPNGGGMCLAPEYRIKLDAFDANLAEAIFGAVEAVIKMKVAAMDEDLGVDSGIVE